MGRTCNEIGNYKLVPIRYEDRFDIMQWRNKQIFHLRQKEPLTEELQDKYFKNVVAKLYDEEYPEQILFSYLEKDKCIGYGGLVHIDWYSQNAEISFIIDPTLEKECFNLHWKMYLSLLYKYAFEDLNLHKVYTYAFDVRPYLYEALEEGGLIYEAHLKEHFFFNREYKDVVTHYKLNPIILENNSFYLRKVTIEDAQTLYYWANEASVRSNSFNTEPISWEGHLNWFRKKLETDKSEIYILYNSNIDRPLGQIRLDYSEEEDSWYIDYSIDKLYRGKKLGSIVLNLIKEEQSNKKLKACVKSNNLASIKTFIKSDFKECSKISDEYLIYENI